MRREAPFVRAPFPDHVFSLGTRRNTGPLTRSCLQEDMGSPDYLSYGFALVVFTGGVMGYVKAGSAMSLASGVTFGGLLAYGAVRMSADPKNFLFPFAVTAILLGLMGYRFYNSGKFMPAGLVAALSLAQVVRLAIRFA